jgi:hypothetical protein
MPGPFTKAQTGQQLNMTPQAVGYAAQRGKGIAKQNDF